MELSDVCVIKLKYNFVIRKILFSDTFITLNLTDNDYMNLELLVKNY